MLAALCGAATYHASRVLAPPEFAGGRQILVDERAAGGAPAVPAASPRGYVDAYAVGGGPERPVPAERRLVLAPREVLVLRGWTAVSVAPAVLPNRVAVALDGRPAEATVRTTARLDVARMFQQAALARSGYEATLRAPARPGSYRLEVRAFAHSGAVPYAVGGPLTLTVR